MPSGRSTKKPKVPLPPSPPTTLLTARASLTSLPIEILAEVLLYTCSPPTVLAVSRTCSFLHRTLTQNPSASFIWRGVRNTCKPLPLPDITSLWGKSEAEYAAFVFDGGVCEVCRKTTRAMYVSFAVLARLCGSWYCRRKFLNEFLVDISSMFPRQKRQSLWVPFVESSLCFHPSAYPSSRWPSHDNLLVRRNDLKQFRLDCVVYEAAEQPQATRTDTTSDTSSTEGEDRGRIIGRCNAAIQRFPIIMELSALLISWKFAHDREYEDVKKSNQTWTKYLAEHEGWNMDDLIASQTYGSLQRRKTSLLEAIRFDDVYPIRSAIESELLEMQARRQRQTSEAAYRERLTEVKKIYECMRCGTLTGPHMGTSNTAEPLNLPPLSVFYTLPSVRVLKGSPDPSVLLASGVSAPSDIKSSPLATSLIISDIHAWLVPVQTHLMRLLGYSDRWRSASTRTLPPLKRVTARFFCRKCGEGEVGRGYQRQRCLDFKGVCSHVCVAAQRKRVAGPHQEASHEGEVEVTGAGDRNKQERGKSKGKRKSGMMTSGWEVDAFEKDEKAIRLIRTILKLVGLSEEDPLTYTYLSTLGGVIRCKTCKGWIVMDFDSAIGHAHRHESMEIELSTPSNVVFSKEDANDRVISSSWSAFKRGTTELLLEPSYRGCNLRKKVNYGCKHCFYVHEQNILAGPEKLVKGKGARVMNFNGLRSHVKEKHGIQAIRDEDFFCCSSVQNEDRESHRE